MGKLIDLTGQVFGRLSVVERSTDYKNPCGTNSPRWECVCNCGNICIVRGCNLRRGETSSCGCLQKEIASSANTTHGRTNTHEYDVWRGMVSRCTNEKDDFYKDYGGRGISVCVEWKDKFINFFNDMGIRPSKVHSLERLNSDLGYSLENCIWVENKYQARNKRKRKDNKTGITGVSLREFPESRYLSVWRDIDGKSKSKTFSIKRYGDELAFFMACEYREQMINLLNLQGAGYSIRHGK